MRSRPQNLTSLYERLAIVTQSNDLWSIERLKTILLFNLGAYDHLARRGSPARPPSVTSLAPREMIALRHHQEDLLPPSTRDES